MILRILGLAVVPRTLGMSPLPSRRFLRPAPKKFLFASRPVSSPRRAIVAMNGSESSHSQSEPSIGSVRVPPAAPPTWGARVQKAVLQFFVQVRILFWKNVILFIRNWKGTVGQFVAPVIVVLLLLGSFFNFSARLGDAALSLGSFFFSPQK